jgi:hypothetical protein
MRREKPRACLQQSATPTPQSIRLVDMTGYDILMKGRTHGTLFKQGTRSGCGVGFVWKGDQK